MVAYTEPSRPREACQRGYKVISQRYSGINGRHTGSHVRCAKLILVFRPAIGNRVLRKDDLLVICVD